jgi:hypothetical protein
MLKTLRSIIIIRRRQTTVGASDIHPNYTGREKPLVPPKQPPPPLPHPFPEPSLPSKPPHSSLTADHTTAKSSTHSTNNWNTNENHHECQRKTIITQAVARLRLRQPSPYPCRSRTSNNNHRRRLLRHCSPRLHTRSMTVLLHPTAPASTNDHTRSLRRRNG